MKNNKIINLSTPSDDNDAVTKNYVDNLYDNITYPNITSGTYTKVTINNKG
jgi:hypothetical protein